MVPCASVAQNQEARKREEIRRREVKDKAALAMIWLVSWVFASIEGAAAYLYAIWGSTCAFFDSAFTQLTKGHVVDTSPVVIFTWRSILGYTGTAKLICPVLKMSNVLNSSCYKFAFNKILI